MAIPNTIQAAPQPGFEAKKQYENFIGGEWVAPGGQYFENSRRSPARCSARWPLDRRRHREGARCRARRRAAVGQDLAGRARACSTRSPTGSRRTWSGSRWPSRGTTASRSARPSPPISRWRSTTSATSPPHPRAGGSLGEIDDDTVAYHFHEPLGRGRPDHPVELPDPDGGVEAGAGAGRRQRGGAQAGRADPGLDAVLISLIADLLPPGRAQRGQRLRRRGGQAAGLEQPDRQDRLHRRDHHRPADHAVRQPEPDPGHPGAGRQEPQHLLLRCDGRQRRLPGQGAGGLHHVRPQPGRGVHLPVALADPVDIYDEFLGWRWRARSAPRPATRWTPRR